MENLFEKKELFARPDWGEPLERLTMARPAGVYVEVGASSGGAHLGGRWGVHLGPGVQQWQCGDGRHADRGRRVDRRHLLKTPGSADTPTETRLEDGGQPKHQWSRARPRRAARSGKKCSRRDNSCGWEVDCWAKIRPGGEGACLVADSGHEQTAEEMGIRRNPPTSVCTPLTLPRGYVRRRNPHTRVATPAQPSHECMYAANPPHWRDVGAVSSRSGHGSRGHQRGCARPCSHAAPQPFLRHMIADIMVDIPAPPDGPAPPRQHWHPQRRGRRSPRRPAGLSRKQTREGFRLCRRPVRVLQPESTTGRLPQKESTGRFGEVAQVSFAAGGNIFCRWRKIVWQLRPQGYKLRRESYKLSGARIVLRGQPTMSLRVAGGPSLGTSRPEGLALLAGLTRRTSRGVGSGN